MFPLLDLIEKVKAKLGGIAGKIDKLKCIGMSLLHG